MRYALMALWLLLCAVTPASARVSVGIAMPGVSIGINLPAYPELVLVPGYPVYYAPRLEANYFFYDGRYWIYTDDDWYVSHWYNGPWDVVCREYVPLFILRVPVYYYRRPPAHFHEWRPGAPPHWGKHWGHGWERRHSGWDQWNRSSAPAPAPLPDYQRQYSGERYPQAEQQPPLHKKHYRHQPRDAVMPQQDQRQEERGRLPSPQRWQAEPQNESQERAYPPQRIQQYNPPSSLPQDAAADSRSLSPQGRGKDAPRSAPPVLLRHDAQDQRKPPQQEPEQPEQQVQGPEIKSQDHQDPQQSRKFKGTWRNEGRERDGREDRYRTQGVMESE